MQQIGRFPETPFIYGGVFYGGYGYLLANQITEIVVVIGWTALNVTPFFLFLQWKGILRVPQEIEEVCFFVSFFRSFFRSRSRSGLRCNCSRIAIRLGLTQPPPPFPRHDDHRRRAWTLLTTEDRRIPSCFTPPISPPKRSTCPTGRTQNLPPLMRRRRMTSFRPFDWLVVFASSKQKDKKSVLAGVFN